jgi:hypothetical protein
MTRREQYELFLPFFKAEEERYAALTQRGAAFLGFISVISLFGGASLLKGKPLMGASVIGLSVLLAVLCALMSLIIRSYWDICDVEELVITIEEEQYEEEDVYTVLLAGLADAVCRNRGVNDQRANWLKYSASFFALSIITVVITSIVTR